MSQNIFVILLFIAMPFYSSAGEPVSKAKILHTETSISMREKDLRIGKIYVVQQNKENNFNIEVDLSLLASIPSRRQAALSKRKVTEDGSSSEIYDGMVKYFDSLKEMINELRTAYYFHDDFPEGLWRSVDDVSLFQTAIIYPFYPTSGASYFSNTWARNQIAVAEQLIKEMAKNICQAAHEKGVVVKGASLTFDDWEREYNRELPNKKDHLT